VTLFNSYAVVRLRQRTGDLARDTYAALERVLADYPQRPTHLARLHLAAAFLGRTLSAPSWREHRARAEEVLKDYPRFAPSLSLLQDR